MMKKGINLMQSLAKTQLFRFAPECGLSVLVPENHALIGKNTFLHKKGVDNLACLSLLIPLSCSSLFPKKTVFMIFECRVSNVL